MTDKAMSTGEGTTHPDSGNNVTVSVIIVTYNGRRYLDDCLDSVSRELDKACETIVVDNASRDGSADVIAKRHPGVLLVRNSENRGFAAACNQGAQIAKGRVLVFLNQDTRVESGWLDGLVRGLEPEETVGLTTSKILLMSRPDWIHLCGQDVHYAGLVFGKGFMSPTDRMNRPKEVAAVSGASFAIRRKLWESLKGFDETFYMYYEETDLSWRARLCGYRCRYIPESIVYHDYQPSNPSFLRLYHSFRNRHMMLLKNWRWMTLFLLAPALLLGESIEWGLAVAHGRQGLRAKIQAHRWIAEHFIEIKKLHAKTQEGRKVPDSAIQRERAHRLTPRTITGGLAGCIVVNICTIFFLLYRRSIQPICKLLDL